ncbi:C-C motif chemokine 4-like isoform X2 [Petaurus breviceps papuanus]|uniref:C-C motif chemokine 4-like isoform X2 n=1 Tax=Petaurus breviceps papuanus TaxID=3040969 RepID=UPI0036DE04FD
MQSHGVYGGKNLLKDGAEPTGSWEAEQLDSGKRENDSTNWLGRSSLQRVSACSLLFQAFTCLRIMKVFVAGLFILFLVMAFNSPAFLLSNSDAPTSCCYYYVKKQFPRKFVIDYYETSSLCSQPAVVFQTRRGRQVCANPSDTWVQNYMEELELNLGAQGPWTMTLKGK